ncbi:glypican-5-like [Anneissia japonica]|uniref:glypican-5-like n=1 Tax=Anneissia japonica TaxID=1529436 RepID=UPI0014258BFD|nr:glypican-5-like [Anneissia japonica]
MEDIFEEDYNRISGEVSSLLTKFFDDARDFLFSEQGASDIPTFVDHFFDNLFPLIYIEELNRGRIKSGISTSYARCLATNRKTIRPFGSVPKWTKESLENSLLPAQILLQSIELGIKVINTTNNIKLTESCHNALTRMSFCQYCSGYVDLKPCNALCLNVMTGCFAGLYEVDYHWGRFLSAILRLTSSMSSDHDLERVIRNLPKRTINALNYLRNNKEKILDEANKICGNPKDVQQSFLTKNLQSLSGVRINEDYNGESMYVRINVFAYSLRNSESFLRSLPNQICFLNKEASDFDSRCWTGKRYGNYQKFVSSSIQTQQGRNTEVKFTGREPEMKQTQDLSQLLQNMRKVILVSLAETYDNEISGSGSGCDGDEECERGSGSGEFTTSATPTGDTGGNYVKVTIKDTKNAIVSTNVPPKDFTTDSDFSFENTNSQDITEEVSKTTVEHLTTKRAKSTTRQTTPTVNRSTIDVTTKLVTKENKPDTTQQPSTNKFIPTKPAITGRPEVDTIRGSGHRLPVVWALIMAASCLTLLL